MKPLSFSPALRNGRIVVAVLGALLGAFPAPPCSAQLSLGTSFGGATPSDGVMFDVRALSSVVLQAFDLHLASGTWDLEVYVVTSGGSFQGVETNAAAWTLVASVTGVMSNGSGVPTPLGTPVNVPLLAGAVQGVYVTATNGPAVRAMTGYVPETGEGGYRWLRWSARSSPNRCPAPQRTSLRASSKSSRQAVSAWPAARSTTRPPRKRLRTRRATAQDS